MLAKHLRSGGSRVLRRTSEADAAVGMIYLALYISSLRRRHSHYAYRGSVAVGWSQGRAESDVLLVP